jgi:hypothetical protein
MNGMLKKNQNKICLVIDLTGGDKIINTERFRPGKGAGCCMQGLEDVPLSEFKKIWRVILNNELYPAHGFREAGDEGLPRGCGATSPLGPPSSAELGILVDRLHPDEVTVLQFDGLVGLERDGALYLFRHGQRRSCYIAAVKSMRKVDLQVGLSRE